MICRCEIILINNYSKSAITQWQETFIPLLISRSPSMIVVINQWYGTNILLRANPAKFNKNDDVTNPFDRSGPHSERWRCWWRCWGASFPFGHQPWLRASAECWRRRLYPSQESGVWQIREHSQSHALVWWCFGFVGDAGSIHSFWVKFKILRLVQIVKLICNLNCLSSPHLNDQHSPKTNW